MEAAIGVPWQWPNSQTEPVKTHVESRSYGFPPNPGEENVLNRGRFGKRLVEFFVLGLKVNGFEPVGARAEDCGWVVPNDTFDLWIGCANCDEYPDGFLCFIEPHQPTLRRFLFWKIDIRGRIEALQRAIDEVLSSNPAVRDKKWWTHDEFMHPW